ncbi:MAG: hypothetical protein QOF89_5621 [Acidobacteriota bacterium]|jgi:hypothetical protein|nr:hypothetical protein [Acidobacteriota bacterium]
MVQLKEQRTSISCSLSQTTQNQDAPWIAERDVQELPPPMRLETPAGGGAPVPSRPPVRVPASERLDFEYVEDPETQLPLNAYDLLEDLVEAHRHQGATGASGSSG